MHNVLGHTPEGLPLDPHIYILLCSDFDAINAASGGFFCRLHRISAMLYKEFGFNRQKRLCI